MDENIEVSEQRTPLSLFLIFVEIFKSTFPSRKIMRNA